MVDAEAIRADKELTQLIRAVQAQALMRNKVISCARVTREIARTIKENGQEALLIDKIIPL